MTATFLDVENTQILQNSFKQRQFARGTIKEVRDFFQWSDINDYVSALSIGKQDEKVRLKIVSDTRNIPVSSFWQSPPKHLGVSPAPQLDVARLNGALDDGATLAITSAHEVFPRIRALSEEISLLLDRPTQVNCYASFRSQPAFKTHWDSHDVLAVQTSGSKRWRVWRPTRPFPLAEDIDAEYELDESVADLVWEGSLKAGEFILVPRGWWHSVVAEDRDSCHLTIGLLPITGGSFLQWAVNSMLDELDVRRDLSFFSIDDEGPLVVEKLKKIVDDRLDLELLRDYAAMSRHYTKNSSKLSLPFVSQAEVEVDDDVELVLNNPRGIRCFYRDDDVVLTDGVHSWIFDSSIEPELNFICEELKQPKKLLSNLPSKIRRDVLADISKLLFSEGVVRVSNVNKVA